MGLTLLRKSHQKFHYKRRLVMLQKGSDPVKKLFLIHDGTGRIEGYLPFCASVDPRFEIYGVVLDDSVDGIPRNIRIEELASKYVDCLLDLTSGPFYLAGWSIGGNIAIEMANQLEARNEQVELICMFDTPQPGFYPKGSVPSFSVSSEYEFFKRFIKSDALLRELYSAVNMESFYSQLLDAPEGAVDWEAFFGVMDNEWPFPLVKLANLTAIDRLYLLNINRNLHHARTEHIPLSKGTYPVHMFQAMIDPIPDLDEWSKYCDNFTIHEVHATHYSIFDEEHKEELAPKFHSILVKESRHDTFVR
ncbi:thioesterase domain-containing protein [Brevibacillus sp. SYSU BS000544]|uniref:thioesterase domain-containing protein n=1 Tax=Brevibacillus sp. SYSU BS000544 TaxID=3416443 RepID=UPI003CE46DBC